jgi:8-oxo-dGTP pyrophosphatase MutT (NUDIX family)
MKIEPFVRRLKALRERAPFVFAASSVPQHFRRAAVLIPFWREGGDLRVLLTKRSSRMSRHAGQVAFPGGLVEDGESWEEAALREAHEEVGIEPSTVTVVGRLDDAWGGAGNHIVPVVGWLDTPPRLVANSHEVAELLVPRVSELLLPESREEREVTIGDVRFVDQIVRWETAEAHGLSADLLLEALEWGTGGTPQRGHARERELAAYLKAKASAS